MQRLNNQTENKDTLSPWFGVSTDSSWFHTLEDKSPNLVLTHFKTVWIAETCRDYDPNIGVFYDPCKTSYFRFGLPAASASLVP